MTVTDKDFGWKNFVKQAKFWSEHDIVMGWVEGKKENRTTEDGGTKDFITNATLATVHEFGTTDGRIPAGRLGLREWSDRSQQQIGEKITQAYKNAIPRGNAKREMNKVGLWAVSSWKQYLRDVQPGPEWSDATEKMKVAKLGNSRFLNEKKLIVSSQLINGATHQVRRKGAGSGGTVV